jgi:hypothetical protein
VLDENAAVLTKAGVPVAINTDDGITESRFMLRTGAIAVRGGMPEAASQRSPGQRSPRPCAAGTPSCLGTSTRRPPASPSRSAMPSTRWWQPYQ